ncbi:MAG TPA: cyclic nucleotide-binding domain-containing protein [Ktedonobacteraceae bacterium]
MARNAETTATLDPVIERLHRKDARPLTPEQIRFEIDMCIGCDRCMLACPVPISATVSIADLNYATISGLVSAQLAQFTTECVLCGSCVPVCPVDNHRDLLMLSLKQRLGPSWNGPVDAGRVQAMLPAGWNIATLLYRLREQPVFRDARHVPDAYLLHLVSESQMLALPPGSILLREGEFGRDTFFLLEGQCELSRSAANGEALPVAVVRRGEYIGDYAMRNLQQHAATARAQTMVLALVTPEQTMQRLVELTPEVQHIFERTGNARALEMLLQRVELFQGIGVGDLRWLAGQAHMRSYERYERLFSEEQHDRPAPAYLHVLLDGFVKVARHLAAGSGHDTGQERIIAYRQGGDYFAGGLDMLGDRRAVTVSAITRTRVAEIAQPALMQLCARYPQVMQRFNERLQRYSYDLEAARTGLFATVDVAAYRREQVLSGGNANPLSQTEARASLHALVDDGVVEGTEVLVIDLDRCVHCGECEAACARRHGHSRMNRKGMAVGNISIATACRHCQDPVCLLCSRAGIARRPSGEVYITENCIGCGICAERCPYNTISIVTLAEERAQPTASDSLWQRFNTLLNNGYGKEYGKKSLPVVASPSTPRPLEGYDSMMKKIAVKCDLCAGYDNQACIQACPTGAAFRVQPASFFGSTETILQRKAI